ncbi:RND family transporter [Halomonas campisalis]|uniref:RND family transporter n=1 Tax=Billgrantia campisalis TaxID=74661 RepID=A0ABS9P5E8_9GAMM|nr:MMPL family transporter [Halomonas campisalis]MCG6656989.1 RND family transporter [Halomonas campisalis]MDR5862176.1 MMPL family transporter [Halomonas campisalis]
MTNRHSESHNALLHPLQESEPLLERFFFLNRVVILAIFAALTLFLGYQASTLRLEASFEKMLPTAHPYIQNHLQYQDQLRGTGNAVRIAVETTEGDIFTHEFQETLQNIHDEVFFINGVNRSALESIWSPGVRWREVTEEGFDGGPVLPDGYDGSPESLETLRENVYKSGQIGALASNDLRSAVVYAPLYDRDPQTGEALDYHQFAQDLERQIRDKYESDTIRIHIIGFAKLVGTLIEGASQVTLFFAVALGITAVLLYLYSRCLRATSVAITCSVMAVIWQLGLLSALGFSLDPYSMLVPFLVFAIGVSHSVQVINAIAHEAARGASRLMSSRLAFRSLYVAGLVALISDGFGFATLMVIEIQVIRDLAVAASLGVAAIILTNLIVLPILMSYVGVSRSSLEHLARVERKPRHPLWDRMVAVTNPRVAGITVLVALAAMGYGLWKQQDLKIGDLDAGAPELRPDSRYNRDVAFFGDYYSTSTDLFVVMVETPPQQCADYDTLYAIDQLQWKLQNLPGVQSTRSLADFAKRYMSASNEGAIKWHAINRNQRLMDAASIQAPSDVVNSNCSLAPVLIYLDDHKAETLETVVTAVEAFTQQNDLDGVNFLMASGNAGIEAATNIVIGDAHIKMLIWVYGVVILLCLLTFRSIRTVVCIILPLMLTSVLCQVLMYYLNIGVKVATLPVIALGVGIGVDYGIYIYSKLESYLKQGMPLRDAYFNTLNTTGKAVAFTGFTLAIGVGTWIFSPIKFQADMGILLAFMFLWNMLGAMVLMPALTCLLMPKRIGATGSQSQHPSPSDHPQSRHSQQALQEELS